MFTTEGAAVVIGTGAGGGVGRVTHAEGGRDWGWGGGVGGRVTHAELLREEYQSAN